MEKHYFTIANANLHGKCFYIPVTLKQYAPEKCQLEIINSSNFISHQKIILNTVLFTKRCGRLLIAQNGPNTKNQSSNCKRRDLVYD